MRYALAVVVVAAAAQSSLSVIPLPLLEMRREQGVLTVSTSALSTKTGVVARDLVSSLSRHCLNQLLRQ